MAALSSSAATTAATTEKVKANGLCKHADCEFHGGQVGYCSLHLPTGLMRSAAEREKASKTKVAILEKAHVKEMYTVMCEPYLITQDAFAKLLLKAKSGIKPSDLFNFMRDEKWLLKSDQAHELCSVATTSAPLSVNASTDTLLAYEDAVYSRVWDRWNLRFEGHQGLYHDESYGVTPFITCKTIAAFVIHPQSRPFFW